MAVQNSRDNTTVPFILSKDSLIKYGTIIIFDGARVAPIEPYTVMGKIVGGDDLWVPWNDITLVDGGAIPRGIYIGPRIEIADLDNGVKTGCTILVGDATVNEELVVFDLDTYDAETIIGAGTIYAISARYALSQAAGIFFEGTENISEFEN